MPQNRKYYDKMRPPKYKGKIQKDRQTDRQTKRGLGDLVNKITTWHAQENISDSLHVDLAGY